MRKIKQDDDGVLKKYQGGDIIDKQVMNVVDQY